MDKLEKASLVELISGQDGSRIRFGDGNPSKRPWRGDRAQEAATLRVSLVSLLGSLVRSYFASGVASLPENRYLPKYVDDIVANEGHSADITSRKRRLHWKDTLLYLIKGCLLSIWRWRLPKDPDPVFPSVMHTTR